ncbi:hypothetical protein C8R45DRAFT_936969 [Mycena sanguinolenta]|nr:hypothetical protein C8R45DRAFT_936969 [Mycena sanguinolenta]
MKRTTGSGIGQRADDGEQDGGETRRSRREPSPVLGSAPRTESSNVRKIDAGDLRAAPRRAESEGGSKSVDLISGGRNCTSESGWQRRGVDMDLSHCIITRARQLLGANGIPELHHLDSTVVTSCNGYGSAFGHHADPVIPDPLSATYGCQFNAAAVVPYKGAKAVAVDSWSLKGVGRTFAMALAMALQKRCTINHKLGRREN